MELCKKLQIYKSVTLQNETIHLLWPIDDYAKDDGPLWTHSKNNIKVRPLLARHH